MKIERSNIIVEDFNTGATLREGFHDEFDALEWAERNLIKGTKIIIKTIRVIEI
ncbi:hypothetical protein J7J18_03725 [bacterium]|nr:hypothetical protein [bacterium]